MKIFKWDDDSGDLGVCLPDELVERLGIREADDVEVTAYTTGQLIISVSPAKAGAEITILLTEKAADRVT